MYQIHFNQLIQQVMRFNSFQVFEKVFKVQFILFLELDLFCFFFLIVQI